jgi:hypothetical protein
VQFDVNKKYLYSNLETKENIKLKILFPNEKYFEK